MTHVQILLYNQHEYISESDISSYSNISYLANVSTKYYH